MSAIPLASLNQISNYLKVPISKLSLNSDKLPICILNNKSFTGFVNIILNLLEQSQVSLLGTNSEEEAEIRQWLEYCVTYVSHITTTQTLHQIMQELNDVLSTNTYFVGNCMTIADIAIYYTLQNPMERLTYLDKEKYLNVSRWYDNIQQNNDIRNNKPMIDFSTIFLACLTIR